MEISNERMVTDCYERYTNNKANNNDPAAFLALAEIHYVLERWHGKTKPVDKWREVISKDVQFLARKQIRNTVIRDSNELEQLFSEPAIFNADEILFILILFHSMSLVLNFASYIGWKNFIEIDPLLQEKIENLREDKTHSQAFAEALVMMKKSWGLPVDFEFLKSNEDDWPYELKPSPAK